MTARKRILFTIDSLGIGGAEKSLVTLLNMLDYSRYEVDLQLLTTGGEFMRFVPAEVNILPQPDYMRFLELPLRRQIMHPRRFAARALYSWRLRRSTFVNADMASLYWRTLGRMIAPSDKYYDAAIAYSQGLPTFYTAEKVHAGRKLAWVNIDYNLRGPSLDFQRRFYAAYDRIVAVSDYVREHILVNLYPEFADKLSVMWDIVDPETISRMSLLPSEKHVDRSAPVIMTVGRYSPQKGYDLAIAAAKILRDRGVRFRWYAVGEGDCRREMERLAEAYGLSDVFILTGAAANPYSCMRQCDVYVQPSRHEGFGLTIAEARILGRPVVCTHFEGVEMQITHGVNGLITSFDPTDIADAVERLLNEEQLRADIVSHLETEKRCSAAEPTAFYRLLEE